MKTIPLKGKSGKVALVDDEDYERLSVYNWHVVNGYAKRKVDDRDLAMSRDILGVPNGTGHAVVVDHINGDKLDNRRQNLRICTQGENVVNSRKRRTHRGRPPGSTHKGVSRNGPHRWRARIVVDGHERFLGNFNSEAQAAEAYRAAAREYFGDFARID